MGKALRIRDYEIPLQSKGTRKLNLRFNRWSKLPPGTHQWQASWRCIWPTRCCYITV